MVGEVVLLLEVGNSLLVKVVLLVGVAWHSIGGGGRGRGEEASSEVYEQLQGLRAAPLFMQDTNSGCSMVGLLVNRWLEGILPAAATG